MNTLQRDLIRQVHDMLRYQFDTSQSKGVDKLIRNHPYEILVDVLIEDHSLAYIGTLLHFFAIYCYPDYQILFLDKRKINVNILDSHGKSPLYWVCANGNRQAMELLLKHGANVNLLNDRGESAFSQLCGIIGAGSLETLDFLIENGADVNCRFDKDGTKMTPLFLKLKTYCEYSNNDSDPDRYILLFVQRLLNAGADPNFLDSNNEGVLYMACRYYDCEMIKILIDGGCDYHHVNNNGELATDLIPESHIKEEIVEYIRLIETR